MGKINGIFSHKINLLLMVQITIICCFIMGKIYEEKLMGKIYGENLWGKLMGKINGENLRGKFKGKIMYAALAALA